MLARDSVHDSYSTVADDAGAPGTAPRIAFDERWQGCVPPSPMPLERDMATLLSGPNVYFYVLDAQERLGTAAPARARP